MLVKKLLTLCAFCAFAFSAQVQANEVTEKPQDKQKQLIQEETKINEKCPCTKEKCPCTKQLLAHAEVEKETPKKKKAEETSEQVKEEAVLAACPGGKCPAPAPVPTKKAADENAPVATPEAETLPQVA